MLLCDLEVEASPVETLDLPEGVPPLRAFYLYISTGCNLKCRHCWVVPNYVNGQPDPGDVINVDALRKAVAEAKPMGLRSAKITGGEPMLHPRFQELVNMLSVEGLVLDMETNGTLLTQDIARWLKEETRVGFISVSLDGADEKTHDEFRGVPGAFRAALRGLDSLVKVGYRNVQVIMSVYRRNRSQVDRVVDLAELHGAGSVKINPITKTGRGMAMHKRGEALDFNEQLDLAQYVHDDLAKTMKIQVFLNVPPALRPLHQLWKNGGCVGDCGVKHILGILGTGDIAMCGIGRTIPELIYGRLGRDSIRDIWLNHPMMQSFRRELDNIPGYPGICGDCVHAKSCRTGCVAMNFVDGKRLIWPSKFCTTAECNGIFPMQRRRRDKKET